MASSQRVRRWLPAGLEYFAGRVSAIGERWAASFWPATLPANICGSAASASKRIGSTSHRGFSGSAASATTWRESSADRTSNAGPTGTRPSISTGLSGWKFGGAGAAACDSSGILKSEIAGAGWAAGNAIGSVVVACRCRFCWRNIRAANSASQRLISVASVAAFELLFPSRRSRQRSEISPSWAVSITKPASPACASGIDRNPFNSTVCAQSRSRAMSL